MRSRVVVCRGVVYVAVCMFLVGKLLPYTHRVYVEKGLNTRKRPYLGDRGVAKRISQKAKGLEGLKSKLSKRKRESLRSVPKEQPRKPKPEFLMSRKRNRDRKRKSKLSKGLKRFRSRKRKRKGTAGVHKQGH
uniref:Uncharacterized protein n=1 Tax=Amorphochlora amoebiformis TaxID=1561963 RepID=A0A7S0DRI7_9EUKA|mmetsp:Transcript_3569/g.5487  ORF Transcript_3569/g.5487 Transcript_3569/m.5487 type:complete len:133 (+) Transcript_3569:99-497(+)